MKQSLAAPLVGALLLRFLGEGAGGDEDTSNFFCASVPVMVNPGCSKRVGDVPLDYVY